jgi:uncharacterized membrane protein YccC
METINNTKTSININNNYDNDMLWYQYNNKVNVLQSNMHRVINQHQQLLKLLEYVNDDDQVLMNGKNNNHAYNNNGNKI